MGAAEARAQLSTAARAIWADPSMVAMRDTLAASADAKYAGCLANLAAKNGMGKAANERCAREAGLSAAYKGAWGKPSRGA